MSNEKISKKSQKLYNSFVEIMEEYIGGINVNFSPKEFRNIAMRIADKAYHIGKLDGKDAK